MKVVSVFSAAWLVPCAFAFAAAPEGWAFHGWSRYKPDPVAETVEEDGAAAIRVVGVDGERGTQLVSKEFIPASCGDRIVVVFEAKGRGRVSAAANHYDAGKKWNPPDGSFSRAAYLSQTWRQFRFSFDVGEGKSAPTRFVAAAIGCGHGDELTFRNFRAECRRSSAPLPKVTPEDAFDPAAAGWKMVFADDFDGPEGAAPDDAKWEVLRRRDAARLDGGGHLAIACDFGRKATNKLESASLWTRQSWRYGYFESRLRFTRNNGWWSSFWLYGWQHRNPSEDGSEIDIYEDANTRHKVNGKNPLVLDHTLHLYFDDRLKSYSAKSRSKGSIDDFHVVGCKWTPFEITMYVDGRRTATFDAFRCGTISVPLHAILSGCIMNTWGARDTTGFKFPEHFLVDYVRVWAYPEAADAPRVSWLGKGGAFTRNEGDLLEFEVAVESTRPVKAVHFFDSGCHLGTRTSPPWRFEIPFSEEGFGRGRLLETGSQGVPPDWRRLLHSFRALAVDEDGAVGETAFPVRHVLAPADAGANGPSAVQKIPGLVAFSDAPDGWRAKIGTNDRIACDVDVAEDGVYEGTLTFGSVRDDHHKFFVLVDGRHVATVRCPPGKSYERRKSPPVRLRLSAGRHRLVFVPVGFIFAGPMEFRKVESQDRRK